MPSVSRPTTGPTKSCGRRSRYDKHAPFIRTLVYRRAYNTYYYINILYFVMGIDYYNNSGTSIQQQYIHDIVHKAF